MTGEELKAKAIGLYGKRGWASSLARAVGKSRFQVWRYSKLDEVPRTIELVVSHLRKKANRKKGAGK